MNDNEVDVNDLSKEDGIGEEDEEESFENFQVHSTYICMEETNMTSDNSWIVLQLVSKKWFYTRAGKRLFQG